MHFEGICGLKTELNYPLNDTKIQQLHFAMTVFVFLLFIFFLLAVKDRQYYWGQKGLDHTARSLTGGYLTNSALN